MQPSSYKILEYDRIRALLADCASSSLGKERARSIEPSSDREDVVARLAETAEAVRIAGFSASPLGGIRDLRPMLKKVKLGAALTLDELMDVRSFLYATRNVKEFFKTLETDAPMLKDAAHTLELLGQLERNLDLAMDEHGELRDDASVELRRIRRERAAAEAHIKERINAILHAPEHQKHFQDALVTIRDERYVLPVKAEYRRFFPGIVHDQSATGATLFIEPMAIVEAGNDIKQLTIAEQREITRILKSLSHQVQQQEDALTANADILAQIDFAFAKARLAFRMKATEPQLSAGRETHLLSARHPLIPGEKVVPIDIELGTRFSMLLITGPNTGGKTVSMKTLGLLVLMAQSGCFLPVQQGSTIALYNDVFADIGDEQSIEQSLSTFSAHMSNIVSIIDECDDRSLVLFDELGAGTDPTEGAALAIAVIEHVRKCGAIIAATTHYAELKVYATNEPGVQNASCEFDVDTLRPTYRLLVGIPGKSNAFAISKRLGLSDEIIEDAKGRVSSESQSFELTIEKLEKTRLLLEKDREEAAKKLREAQENAKKAAFMKAELEVRLDKADTKSRREAERILADARATAEEVFRELDEMRRMADQDEDASRVNEARAQLRRQLNLSQEALQKELNPEAGNQVSARPVKPGDTVQIKSMGMKATVIDKSPDGTLSLRAGIMNVTAKEDEVLLLENEQAPKQKSAPKGGGGELRSLSIKPEVDLRGMEAVEAVLAAERYLDAAVMAKLKTVTIIHGKGTGALRTAIQQMLKKNKFVKSFRLGRYGEGESGVTVVELK